MTLRKTRRTIRMLGIATFCCVILAYLVTVHTVLCVALCVLALILCIAAVAVNIMFWRCPYCDKPLGRDSGKFCQHCGEKLDMDR